MVKKIIRRFYMVELELYFIIAAMFTTYLVLSPTRCTENEDITHIKWKLEMDLFRIKALKKKINNLKRLLDNAAPHAMYQETRRRIYSETIELWNYLSHELGKAVGTGLTPDHGRVLLQEVAERKRSLLSSQETLPSLDGYQKWRRQEAASVGDLVQRRLRYLQNPPDCSNAGIVLCDHAMHCGFGCQVHRCLLKCLIFAYASQRTLVMRTTEWHSEIKVWDSIFHPMSNSCDTAAANDENGISVLTGVKLDARVGFLPMPVIESVTEKLHCLNLAIPADLAPRIMRFNGDPPSWWVGQILKFILKPKEHVNAILNYTINKMYIKSPIVGVQIRTTDQFNTAAWLHDIAEYMPHVDEYYAQLELTRTVDERRVYLAVDNASIFEDARRRYPQYTFYGDPYPTTTNKTVQLEDRYSQMILTRLIVDLHILSSCNYIVGALSSEMGRMAYEIMQSNRADASNSFFSLDGVYHVTGEDRLDRVAIIANKGGNHVMAFDAGDEIRVTHPVQRNGLGYGTNKRSKKSGLFPWYKTADHLRLYPFPKYKEVPLTTRSVPPGRRVVTLK